MSRRSSRTPARLISRGTRKNVEKQHSTVSKKVAKLENKVATFDKKLADMSNGSVIGNAYRVDVLRLRAQAVRELNSLREKISILEGRIVNYDANDEAVLKGRDLHWGA